VKNAKICCLLAAISIALFSINASAQVSKPIAVEKARVAQYWTKERRENAIPRDLVIDSRGLGYLKRPDGTLQPYGHDVAPQEPPRNESVSPFAGHNVGSGDTNPPMISGMDPDAGTTIGTSYTFRATVTDASGVKSVTFYVQKSGWSTAQSFTPNNSSGDVWEVPLTGFTDGTWSWWVVAKDNAPKGGNTKTSDPVGFTVDTGSSSGSSGGDIVTNAEWTAGGTVQTAAGRLYFEMPNNSKRKGPWTGYVCSGTVATDSTANRSVIITAAHCVYDDANKAFARNVMFIPDQAETSGSGTDLNCDNDPMGCWVPSFGVVDANWTTRTFPDNIKWDYAFYVVDDTGAHAGASAPSDALDVAAKSLPLSFAIPSHDVDNSGTDHTYALGYSYNQDPKFMYCAEDMTTTGYVNWWLPNCGLSGGSSGGPWVQLMDTGSGSGPIISVNSWGYTNSPGMAGPKLNDGDSSASCVFNSATSTEIDSVPPTGGDAGIAVTCP